MSEKRYSLSFTTGSLFHRESVELAALYLELSDWTKVRETVITGNLLQTRTLNTLKRVCREIISRLKTLSHSGLKLLVHGNDQEQAYLLWIAVCHRYRLIAEFATEVLRERFLSLKTSLTNEDFDLFFNQKAEWHNELEQIATSTRAKLRQVLFKMLRQANLLTRNNVINAAMPSPKLIQIIQQDDRDAILYFPLFEFDTQENQGSTA